ncbi:adhesion G protein-coupled receptor E5 [Coregonus clupeaformis]|uniref:adhesion G protein-coupled receptor E5 n=1 Tax=Coregonus clupeaformis TaxID=59861 RepID=UPI001BE04E94|nr:adhesion G protein-coupled receptor E5 [Coregonus clupeaformis]
MAGRVHLLILALHLAPLMEHVSGCGPGFSKNRELCIDENECNDYVEDPETPPICGNNAACSNTVGSYYCQCAPGFRSSTQRLNYTADSPDKCIDINECRENKDGCGPNATCNNTIGSYFCICNYGFDSSTGVEIFFWGQGITCEDRNECAEDITICGKHTQCFNTPGDYYCVCNPGFGLKSGEAQFTGNGESCEEITDQKATTDRTATTDSEDAQGDKDLCKMNKSICGGNGMCHNAADGGHRCACHAGFTNYGDPQGKCTELNCDTFVSENHLELVLPVLQDAVALMRTSCLELSESKTTGPVDGEALLEALLSAIDRLLSGGPLNDNKKVSVLLDLVETALRMIGPLLKHPQTRRSKSHTEVELLVQRNASSPQGPFTLSSTHAQLDSHWETAAGDASYPGFATVSLLSYKGLETSTNHSFSGLKAQEGHSFQINSKVVTATVSNKNTTFLKEPVTFTFSHLKESDEGNYTCVYWDAELGDGTWSDRGCFLVQSNATHTVCSCYHLSSFAVLMALYEFKDTFQLQLITWVGLSLSLLCLFLCILTFSLIRSIQSTRNTIHLHLCLSLFIANLIFLIGISRTENQAGCAVVAGLLHFFFLAAFCWMCLEGVQLFRMVVLVFNTTFRPLYMMAGGYGVPAVIVAISALANAKGYGTERHCWLNLEDGFIWSFFGPVCIIIMVNVFFFLITVWKLAQKFSSLNQDLNNLRKIKAFTITAVAQLCVLGTMWIFGCFQFEESTLAMSYLFTILNSLQGVLVFLMHCLLSKQVREEYGKILDSVCEPRKTKYSEFSSNQSSNSKSQTSKSVQNTGESQI